jgi:hypothetical protein
MVGRRVTALHKKSNRQIQFLEHHGILKVN